MDIINIIDVRTPEEFYNGHAEGAVNIPLNELPNHLDHLKSLKGHLILCCASGMRSGSACQYLFENGITDISNGGPWQNVQNSLINQ